MPKDGITCVEHVVLMKPNRRGQTSVSLPMALLLVLLICLTFAGGASRGDALAQAVIRLCAGVLLATLILFRGEALRQVRGWPLALLAAAVALPLLQLVPLPPSIWSQLPGRDAFLEAAMISGTPQPWRPLALSPDAAWNSFFSLLVPTAALLIVGVMNEADRARVPGLVFALATASAMLAVFQVSGARLDNPLINEVVSTASGIFANPNHQALLLSIGIVAAAAWAADRQHKASLRVPVAGGAAIWFLLMIMASGSRTGLALGFLALLVAVLIVKRALGTLLARVPVRWRWGIVALGLVSIVSLAVVSFTAGRAVSLNRLLVLSTGEDMRSRAFPTVLHMIATYMPFGSGFGSFDPLFRMHEPEALLKFTYFNHAHSDYLEVALESGAIGIALVAVAIGWALRRGISAWRTDPSGMTAPSARFGSAALLLVALASIVDYPARTPTIMAMLAVAAMLVAQPAGVTRPGTLRRKVSRV